MSQCGCAGGFQYPYGYSPYRSPDSYALYQFSQYYPPSQYWGTYAYPSPPYLSPYSSYGPMPFLTGFQRGEYRLGNCLMICQ
ncbi:MAG: hypothetical protein ABSA92_04025 [Candidatus Bathyarchaeia archaeon]